MKHVYLTFFFTLLASLADGQQTEVMPSTHRGVGLRFCNSTFENLTARSVEVSYQQMMRQSKNRIEIDFGFNYGFKISSAYQWVWNIQDELGWYIGPAAGVVFSGFENSSGIGVLAGFQLGIEYSFQIATLPLQASLDLRPLWSVVSIKSSYIDPSLGLSVRYRF